jgi:hypothetical protein
MAETNWAAASLGVLNFAIAAQRIGAPQTPRESHPNLQPLRERQRPSSNIMHAHPVSASDIPSAPDDNWQFDPPDARGRASMSCFVAGTRLLTPDGDIPVQDIRPGAEILVVRGKKDAVETVIWIGRRTVDLARHARPERVAPVRFQAGALGPALPEHDLLLSPDHGLFMDLHLIAAKTLINGATVIQDFSTRSVTYYHIETARHDIVLAEGVPVETYVDTGNRHMFDGGIAAALHPDFAAGATARKAAANEDVVLAARQRLLDRVLALGFAVTDAIDLVVKAGAEKIMPAPGDPPTRLRFELSQPYRDVQLLSSTGVPAHLAARQADGRRLGVAVTEMNLLASGQRRRIALDDPAHQGFYELEGAIRWTDGAARIVLPEYRSRAALEVCVARQAPRWAAAPSAAAISA